MLSFQTVKRRCAMIKAQISKSLITQEQDMASTEIRMKYSKCSLEEEEWAWAEEEEAVLPFLSGVDNIRMFE